MQLLTLLLLVMQLLPTRIPSKFCLPKLENLQTCCWCQLANLLRVQTCKLANLLHPQLCKLANLLLSANLQTCNVCKLGNLQTCSCMKNTVKHGTEKELVETQWCNSTLAGRGCRGAGREAASASNSSRALASSAEKELAERELQKGILCLSGSYTGSTYLHPQACSFRVA